MSLTVREFYARLLGVILIVGAGAWLERRRIPWPSDYDAYFLDKAWERRTFDGVLLGDSRTYRGLSPAIFAEVDAGRRWFNFGFSSLEYSKRYLDRAESLLDSASKERTIVVGIDPGDFCRLSRTQNTFGKFDELAAFEVIGRQLARRVGAHVVQAARDVTWHTDGWVTYRERAEARAAGLDHWKSQYTGDAAEILDDDVAALTDAIKRWRRKGISVYALRMPTSNAMERAEERIFNLDRGWLRTKMASAGAVWIDLPNVDAETSDASHLTESGARRISRLVAERVRAGRP